MTDALVNAGQTASEHEPHLPESQGQRKRRPPPGRSNPPFNRESKDIHDGMYLTDAQTSDGQPALARSEVPTAFALFPREAPTPRDWVQQQAQVVRYMQMLRDGHFAALEEPGLFVDDLRSFDGEVLACGRSVLQTGASR